MPPWLEHLTYISTTCLHVTDDEILGFKASTRVHFRWVRLYRNHVLRIYLS